MQYTRLYAASDGESHFEDVEVPYDPTDYVAGAKPLNLSAFMPAAQAGFMKAPANWTSDWHVSASRNLFVVIRGKWEVTASDGQTRAFTEGNVLLVEDTTGKGHQSRVVGDSDSVAVMVQLH